MYIWVSEIFPTEIRPIGMGKLRQAPFPSLVHVLSLFLYRIFSFRTICGVHHFAPDGPHRLRGSRVQVLSGYNLLVDCFHPHHILLFPGDCQTFTRGDQCQIRG